MSKGLGKVERLILEAVEAQGGIYPARLAPPGSSKAQHQALNRAALSLIRKGLVRHVRYLWCRPRLYLHRNGTAPPSTRPE
jgi:hypothetical protein